MNVLAERAAIRKPKGVIHGEAGTGYENGKLGEFECENCHYYRESDSSCGQSTMVALSKQPKVGTRVKVDPEGCCEFVDRMGKIEPHEADELEEKSYA